MLPRAGALPEATPDARGHRRRGGPCRQGRLCPAFATPSAAPCGPTFLIVCGGAVKAAADEQEAELMRQRADEGVNITRTLTLTRSEENP